MKPIYTLGYIEEEANVTLNSDDAPARKKVLAHLILAELIELKTLLEEYETN